jgi:hypothetical protein
MRCPRWVGLALIALAAGLAMNSLLGPLVSNQIKYRYGTAVTNQGIGLDAIALFGAVPLAATAARLLLREREAGLLLAFAPAAFAAYMMPQYIIGPDYLGLPGNNERFIVFHIGLFILAAAIVLGAWAAVGTTVLQPDSPVSDRRRCWVLIGLAAFIGLGRWLPGLVDATRTKPTNTSYLDNPTAFWLVGFLDLGIIVPAALATTIGLRRGTSWARKAAYTVIGWFALVPASVAAMAITMQINDDPLATTANTIAMTAAALVFLPIAVLLYRPLFTDSRSSHPQAVSPPERQPIEVR